MGRKKDREKQQDVWVASSEIVTTPGRIFPDAVGGYFEGIGSERGMARRRFIELPRVSWLRSTGAGAGSFDGVADQAALLDRDASGGDEVALKILQRVPYGSKMGATLLRANLPASHGSARLASRFPIEWFLPRPASIATHPRSSGHSSPPPRHLTPARSWTSPSRHTWGIARHWSCTEEYWPRSQRSDGRGPTR
jgi:hypothetical protein